MIVVNNGEAINHPSGNGIMVINNENLGGAGGFMRGLIEAGKSTISNMSYLWMTTAHVKLNRFVELMLFIDG